MDLSPLDKLTVSSYTSLEKNPFISCFALLWH